MNQGGLFTRDYLTLGVRDTEAWKSLDAASVAAVDADLKAIFARFPVNKSPSEPRTEDDLIWKVLQRLGWSDYVRQQPLSAKGRENIPDGLLFADAEAKARSDKRISYEKYEEGLVVVESKKWNRKLDRAGKSKDESEVPSSQMLRYLRRVEDLTKGKLRWGFLTNGRLWRLYFRGAKSVAEDFCELDLAAILGIEGFADLATAVSVEERTHWLKVFLLVFRRESFLVPPDSTKTFHDIALEGGKFYEDRVAKDLSRIVFEEVFPVLARGIAANDPNAPMVRDRTYLTAVKEAALILLYRLLFVVYAEDRNLLPVQDRRYDDYGLRLKLRDDIARRIDENDVFSESRPAYWNHARELFEGIAKGDGSIGLPPYNGGLFDADETPLLDRVKLPDAIFAPVVDKLCRVERDGHRRYINYRDLSVQQLGSIYEKLLEYDVAMEDGALTIRLNPFARKGSGSYYTPDELVRLIIERTVGPLVVERLKVFETSSEALSHKTTAKDERRARLETLDPATALLDLKVCDPAMGSGHFLVDLVDWLSDRVIEATVAAREEAAWCDYRSPLEVRIAAIRGQILDQAKAHGWAVKEEQLDDRLIVRRMVLKRVIYGMDKNPMAVELAKVALWLHTFTVGAPLSFLDHHLRCGDSLFGESVRSALNWLEAKGEKLFINSSVQIAKQAAKGMAIVEALTDADIIEVKKSAEEFTVVEEQTEPLAKMLSFIHALEWLGVAGREADRPLLEKLRASTKARGLSDRSAPGTFESATTSWLDSAFGDPFEVAGGKRPIAPSIPSENYKRFLQVWDDAIRLANSESFLSWQIAFPGVWGEWESNEPSGGFDAVIGNPPWDRLKFQEVEWFSARRPEIAHADTAAKRKGLIDALKKAGDPLAKQYDSAVARADAMLRMARDGGAYPLLSGGDVNIYSLFVERALSLIKPAGLVGLLTPSGIASDKTAAAFFRSVSTANRLAALFDFENKKVFFPDIHASFKFCVVVIGGLKRTFLNADCAFYLHAVDEIIDDQRAFSMTGADFALVNPNTGTAPIFRTRRDADLTTAIYRHTPVLVDRSGKEPKSVWPVKYLRMFDMTNDSDLFLTRAELQRRGAYPVGGNRWKRGEEEFVPLYEGKMVQAYDHRAASVEVDTSRLHRPGQPLQATEAQHADPKWLPDPQFWVDRANIDLPKGLNWLLGFKEITAPTNMRTMISCLFPRLGFGNKIPIWLPEDRTTNYRTYASLMCANFNSIPFDYVARQKIHGQTLNLFLVEQLPVISASAYSRKFGAKTAAEIVKAEVLALTYTAHDMEPFARDMDYKGPPFAWDEMDRLKRRAKLDALYFLLYGIADRDDVKYIYSTFPIVERKETETHGRYLSRDYCLMYMNALEAGDPDAVIDLG